MSEFEDKLNTLLSNPDAMAQVMQLAQNLSSPSGENSSTDAPPPQDTAAEEGPDISALLSQFTNGFDPDLLQRLLPVIQQMNRSQSSETSAFLYALRPFLRPERRDKVERAAQLAKMIHLAKVFLTKREE